MVKNGSTAPSWDFSKAWSEFKMPGVDLDGLVALQQRNVEALANANRLAFEGFQAVAKRQAEIARDAFEQGSAAAQELAGMKSVEDRTAKQAKMAKDTFAASLANLRELSTMMSKTANDYVDVVSKRVVDNIDEFQGMTLNGTAKK